MEPRLFELFALRASLVEELEALRPRLEETVTMQTNAYYDFQRTYKKLEEVDHQIRTLLEPPKRPFWKRLFRK